MINHVDFHPGALKDLRRLPQSAITLLKNDLVPGLASGTKQGIALSGIFRHLCKFRFSAEGVSYRIVYLAVADRMTILTVAKRGDIYQRLKQRLR